MERHIITGEGDKVAAGAVSFLQSSVGNGDFVLEQVIVNPIQTGTRPQATLVIVEFVAKEGPRSTVVQYLGTGYAVELKHPFILNTPVSVTGPGYFYVSCVATAINNYFEMTIIYRRESL